MKKFETLDLFQKKVQVPKLTATPDKLLHHKLVDSKSAVKIWNAIGHWIISNIDGNEALLLPCFGVFYLRIYHGDIRMPLFDPLETFMGKHGLTFNAKMNCACKSQKKLPVEDLAMDTGFMNRGEFHTVYMNLVNDIGQAMASCEKTEIDVGVGVIVAHNGSVQQNIIQKTNINRTSPSKRIHNQHRRCPTSLAQLPNTSLKIQLNSDNVVAKQAQRPKVKPTNRKNVASPRGRRIETIAQPSNPYLAMFAKIAPKIMQAKTTNSSKRASSAHENYGKLMVKNPTVEKSKRMLCNTIGCYFSPETENLEIDLSSTQGLKYEKYSTICEVQNYALVPSPRVRRPQQDLPLTTIAGNAVKVNDPNPRMLTMNNYDCKDDHENQEQVNRYYNYIEHAMEMSIVGDILNALNMRVTSLLPRIEGTIDDISPTIRDTLTSLLTMIGKLYANSIKRATLNYAMKIPANCSRLEIPNGIPVNAQIPISWSWGFTMQNPLPEYQVVASMRKRLAKNLLKTDMRVRKIEAYWQEFQNLIFVDVNYGKSSSTTRNQAPPDIIAFEEAQLSFIAKRKQHLEETWIRKCVSLLEEAKQVDILGTAIEQPKRFFNCIATLMSLQLRDLVRRSIEQYVEFFESFNCKDENTSGHPHLPRLSLSFINENGHIKISQGIENIEIRLIGILDNIINANCHIKRVETAFAVPLDFGQEKFISSLKHDHEFVLEARRKIRTAVSNAYSQIKSIVTQYHPYESVFSASKTIHTSISNDADPNTYVDIAKKYYDIGSSIKATVKNNLTIELFYINCSALKLELANVANEATNQALTALYKKAMAMNTKLCDHYKSISNKLQKKATGLNELIELEAYVSNVQENAVQTLAKDLELVKHYLCVLLDWVSTHRAHTEKSFFVSQELISATSVSVGWCGQMEQILHEGQLLLSAERNRIENAFISKHSKFQADLEELESNISSFNKKGDIRHATAYVDQLEEMRVSISSSHHAIELIGEEERKLGWIRTEFLQLGSASQQLEPYHQLWTNVKKFRTLHAAWLKQNIFELSGDDLDHEVHAMHSSICQAIKPLADVSSAAVAVGEVVKTQLDTFKNCVGIVASIGNLNMKERHWEVLKDSFGCNINPAEAISLQRILDLGAVERLPLILKTSQIATMECSISNELLILSDEWDTHKLEIEGADSETLYLAKGSTDTVIELLANQIYRLDALRKSKYSKPFQEKIAQWECSLLLLQKTLKLLCSTQKSWKIVDPLFANSKDISNRLPLANKKYQLIVKHWKGLMKIIQGKPLLGDVVKIPRIVDVLDECTKLLATILSEVRVLLSEKRLKFSRLNFLSDAELIALLSIGNNSKNSNYCIGKMYSSVQEIQFDADLEVRSIKSISGEAFKLTSAVETINICPTNWLLNMDTILMYTIQEQFSSAISYLKKGGALISSTIQWPGQHSILARKIIWTDAMEVAIIEDDKARFNAITEQLLNDCEALASAVQTGSYGHSTLFALQSLLLWCSHAQNITRKFAQNNATSLSDFQWMSKLRYYSTNEATFIGFLDHKFNYGFALQTYRNGLLLTPESVRFVHALSMHICNSKPCIIYGPSGSNKCNLVQSIASDFGKEVTLVNPILEQTRMVQLLLGAIGIRSWALLKNLENVSKAKQEDITDICSTLFLSQRTGSLKVSLFGSEASMHKDFAVIATANNNLKNSHHDVLRKSEILRSCFHSLAPMIPNLLLLCKAHVESMQFEPTDVLANKLASAFEACNSYNLFPNAVNRETLIRRIAIDAADARQRTNNSRISDEYFLYHSVVNLFSLFIVKLTRVQLYSFLQAVFFYNDPDELESSEVQSAVKALCARNRLIPSINFTAKGECLFYGIKHSHAIIVAGPSSIGKSSLITIAQQINPGIGCIEDSTTLNVKELPQIKKIAPESLSAEELFGSARTGLQEGLVGTFTSIVNNAKSNSSETWLVLDGPVSTRMVNKVCNLLHEVEEASCNSGIASADLKVKVIFECENMTMLCPSIVSRCSIVVLDNSIASTPLCCDAWKISSVAASVYTLDGMHGVIEKCMNSIEQYNDYVEQKNLEHGKAYFGESSKLNRTKNVFRIFSASLNEILPILTSENTELTPKQMQHAVQCLFLSAIVWGIGYSSRLNARREFEEYMRTCHETELKCDEPTFGLFFPNNSAPTRQSGSYSIYDWSVVVDWSVRWVPNIELVQRKNIFSLPDDARFVHVPTINSSNCAIMTYKLSSLAHHSVLLEGVNGTGKSHFLKLVHTALENVKQDVPSTRFYQISSADKTKAVLHRFIQKNLKQKGSTTLTAAHGTGLNLFLDDLSNLPAKNAQNLAGNFHEFLRSIMDNRTLYDTGCKSMKKVECLSVVASLTSATSSPALPSRFLRHFIPIGIIPNAEKTILSLYTAIFHLGINKYNLKSELGDFVQPIVQGTYDLHQKLNLSLHQGPNSPLYLFPHIKILRVLQGMLNIHQQDDHAAVEHFFSRKSDDRRKISPAFTVKLWIHEICRTYYDSIVLESEKIWFYEVLKTISHGRLGITFEALFGSVAQDPKSQSYYCLENLRFGEPSISKSSNFLSYSELPDLIETKKVTLAFRDEYMLLLDSDTPIVLFDYAIDKLLRIIRLLKHFPANTPGHLLLLGQKSTGKKSLLNLGAYICQHDVYHVDLAGDNLWRTKFQVLLREILHKDAKCLVIVELTVAMQSWYQEAIADLIRLMENFQLPQAAPNSGSLSGDKLQPAQGQSHDEAAKGQNRAILQQRMKLCLSFCGDDPSWLKTMHAFPDLVKYTNQIFFESWPSSALRSIGENYLGELNLPRATLDTFVSGAVAQFTYLSNLSKNKLTNTRLPIALSPSSFVFQMKLIRCHYTKLTKSVHSDQLSYTKSLSVLEQTKIEIIAEEKRRESTLAAIESIKSKALASNMQIEKQRQILSTKTNLVQAEKVSLELNRMAIEDMRSTRVMQVVNLEVSISTLHDQLDSLLSIEHILSIQATWPISDSLRSVIDCVGILFNALPIVQRVANSSDGSSTVLDYWEPTLELLRDSDMKEDFLEYEMDEITDQMLSQLRSYCCNPTFASSFHSEWSPTVCLLCDWVKCAYSKATSEKEELQFNAKIDSAVEALRRQGLKLSDSELELHELENSLERSVRKHRIEQLETQELTDEANKRIENIKCGNDLLGSLELHIEKWKRKELQLSENVSHLPGYILLSTGQIAYLGPFRDRIRKLVIKRWKAILAEHKLTYPLSFDSCIDGYLSLLPKCTGWLTQSRSSGLGLSTNFAVGYLHPRIPLFVDPSSIAIDIAKSTGYIDDVISGLVDSSTFVSEVEDAMKANRAIAILVSFDKPLVSVFRGLLDRMHINANGSIVFYSEGTSFICSENFRVCVFCIDQRISSQTLHEFGKSLEFIDLDYDTELLSFYLLSQLSIKSPIDYDQNAHVAKRIEIFSLQEKCETLDSDVRSSISTNELDIFGNNTCISQVIQQLESMKANSNALESARTNFVSMQDSKSKLLMCINVAVMAFQSFDELAFYNPCYYCSPAILVSLLCSLKSTWNYSYLIAKILSLSKCTMLSTHYNRFYIHLGLRLLVEQQSHSPLQWEIFDFLLFGDPTGLRCNSIQGTIAENQFEPVLKQESWELLMSLFHQIGYHLNMASGSTITDWFHFIDSANIDQNLELSGMNLLVQLCTYSILNKSRGEKILLLHINKYFSSLNMKTFRVPLQSLASVVEFSENFSPIVCTSSEILNFLVELEQIASLQGRLVQHVFEAQYACVQETLDAALISSMKVGKWLVVSRCSSKKKWFSASSYFKWLCLRLSTEAPHPNFRLFLMCSMEDFATLPPAFHQHCILFHESLGTLGIQDGIQYWEKRLLQSAEIRSKVALGSIVQPLAIFYWSIQHIFQISSLQMDCDENALFDLSSLLLSRSTVENGKVMALAMFGSRLDTKSMMYYRFVVALNELVYRVNTSTSSNLPINENPLKDSLCLEARSTNSVFESQNILDEPIYRSTILETCIAALKSTWMISTFRTAFLANRPLDHRLFLLKSDIQALEVLKQHVRDQLCSIIEVCSKTSHRHPQILANAHSLLRNTLTTFWNDQIPKSFNVSQFPTDLDHFKSIVEYYHSVLNEVEQGNPPSTTYDLQLVLNPESFLFSVRSSFAKAMNVSLLDLVVDYTVIALDDPQLQEAPALGIFVLGLSLHQAKSTSNTIEPAPQNTKIALFGQPVSALTLPCKEFTTKECPVFYGNQLLFHIRLKMPTVSKILSNPSCPALLL